MTQCENARWNFATSLVVDTQGFVRLSVCPSHYWFFGCHVHESKSGKTSVLEAFSRRHATLHLAVLVGSLVGRSVRHIFEFRAAFALTLLPNLPWLDCRVSGLVLVGFSCCFPHRALSLMFFEGKFIVVLLPLYLISNNLKFLQSPSFSFVGSSKEFVTIFTCLTLSRSKHRLSKL